MALLTVEQAAERLGTSVRFIRRLRTEQRIPVFKIGGHVRSPARTLTPSSSPAGKKPPPLGWRTRDRPHGRGRVGGSVGGRVSLSHDC